MSPCALSCYSSIGCYVYLFNIASCQSLLSEFFWVRCCCSFRSLALFLDLSFVHARASYFRFRIPFPCALLCNWIIMFRVLRFQLRSIGLWNVGICICCGALDSIKAPLCAPLRCFPVLLSAAKFNSVSSWLTEMLIIAAVNMIRISISLPQKHIERTSRNNMDAVLSCWKVVSSRYYLSESRHCANGWIKLLW